MRQHYKPEKREFRLDPNRQPFPEFSKCCNCGANAKECCYWGGELVGWCCISCLGTDADA